MSSYSRYTSPTSSPPPHHGHRDHSPSKPSPLRHTLSTRSANSDTEEISSLNRQRNTRGFGDLASGNGTSGGYDSGSSDPFVTRSLPRTTTGSKRERSESPVKKSVAFAKWEQREQEEVENQQQQQHQHSSPARNLGPPPVMDLSPKKLKDDDWRATLGRSETRAALRPVASNVLPDAVAEPPRQPLSSGLSNRNENNEYQRYRPPSREKPDLGPRASVHSPSHSEGVSFSSMLPDSTTSGSPITPSSRNSMATLSRSDSMRASTRPRQTAHARFTSTDNATAQLDGEDLAKLQNSSTPQFQHLSKMATEDGGGDFGIHSPDEQVVGLAGRRRLQRSGSVRPSNGKQQSSFASQYSSTKWMETQRKHLQAYEYLCHIGEARAWLEDVLEPVELPPIVQLEEALRNGVTLAEVVVRLAPSLPSDQQHNLGSQRIFRSTKLQFRHSDNIALFFRFLAQIELPELFRFELVDLYEKKNIPKVIYCIHALSWLLYRKNIVDFRIGNLVGQLQFEEHELEETQKGIDRSGVQMPNFGGMREAMQVEEPEPTPEELLAEQAEVLVDLQAQMRGAIVRLRLGDVMQSLWDAEDQIANLQAVARGGFAREIFDFRFAMDRSTRLFQAAAGGFIVRKRFSGKQNAWKSNEEAVVKLQSLWRGRQDRLLTRQIRSRLQRERHGLKQLQAAIRGALSRWRAGDLYHDSREAEAEVAGFQAQARAALERMRVSAIMESLWDAEDTVCGLQAAVRAARVRKSAKSQKVAVRKAAVDIVRFQAVARGLIHRQHHDRRHGELQIHHGGVMDLQAASRGLLARLQQARVKGALQGRESGIVKLQAALRSHAARTAVDQQRAGLLSHSKPLTKLQGLVQGNLARQRHGQLREELAGHVDQVRALQAISRAMLERQRIGTVLASLEDHESEITGLQSLARAHLERQRIYDDLVAMEKVEPSIIQLQALARAMNLREHVSQVLSEIDEHESAIVDFQAACRAFIVRAHFEEKRKHYNENMQKVIKLQSFVRAKQQGESYKSLVGGKNPPLPVVRKHLHLLTDSNLEFEGEMEAERLRRQVVESVRRNELVEGYIEGMDVKIAMLVGKKITFDELVRHQKHFGSSASQLLKKGSTVGNGSNGFDLKALNKASRKKLTRYEELFFILQTQPAYLSRLLQHLTAKGLAEKEGKNLDRLTMILFGYAQKTREEHLLVKLLITSMQQSIRQSQSLEDFSRIQSGAFYQRLLLSYIRGPKDRSYLKSLLGSMVKNGICAQDHMDLESDPLQIYRAILNNEELSTGQASSRPRDLPREVVIREADVRPKYVEHLQDLRDLCDAFFLSLEETLERMPHGIRRMAAEQFRALREQFPREDPAYIAVIAGNWLWKSYFLPALKEPEMWGVVDRGLSPLHRRNLGQVVTVLGQVAAGRLFGAENLYLQPLNNWVSESLERWQNSLQHLFDASPLDEEFEADQFSDLYAKNKPTLYVKLGDIFALHGLVSDNISAVAPSRGDPIKEILADLGTPKSNETDLGSASQSGEITLTLRSRFTVQEDPNADARALFTATKRYVLYIIKVQSGSNLMEILLRPITHEDDDRWIQLLQEEIAEKERTERRRGPQRQNSHFDPHASVRGAKTMSVYSEAPSNFSEDKRDLLDLQSMSYAELKSSALESILSLEANSIPQQFRVSRHNNYQEILNALAADIRQKHRRRLERQRELESTRATLAQLDSKAEFLEEQLKSYNDYIEHSLETMARSKANAPNKLLMPFSKQWMHKRELERSGRQPRFGSYKYSAQYLSSDKKRVLLSWPAFPEAHWSQLDIVLASDEPGVFHLEALSGSLMLPGASAQLLIYDLLGAEYEGQDVITVFEEAGKAGEGAKLDRAALVELIYKKFYPKN